MIVLGIDPGTTTLGYAVLKRTRKSKKIKVLDFGVIETKNKEKTQEKLKFLYKEIKKLIKKHNPDIISMEKIYFFKNAKTMVQISQAQGIVLLLASQNKKEVQEITPLQVKASVTGYGRANKKQVQAMIKEILKLKETPKPDDAADALGVALCSLLIT